VFGSGFFIGQNTIATNYHVIRGARTIVAKLIIQKKWLRIVDVIGFDEDKDLALLTVEAVPIRPLPFSSRKPVIGEDIYVAGNPEGYEGTFSQGIISGFRRGNFIQITAPISHGSSGGPVLNRQGQVIGMVVAADFEGQNLNFAIASSELSMFQRNAMREYGGRALASDVPPVRFNFAGVDRLIKAGQHCEKGNEYYNAGLYSQARDEYRKAIVLFPNYAEAYNGLGNAYADLSDYSKAIDAYTKAITLKPNYSRAYSGLGTVYEDLSKTHEAMGAYQKAVAFDPGDDYSHYRLGELYLIVGSKVLAQQEYAILKGLNSSYADRLRNDINK